jgi:hypothetical protein
MNKVKGTILAAAFLSTLIAVVTVTTTQSSQEQRKRAAEAMVFLTPPLQGCAVVSIDYNGR